MGMSIHTTDTASLFTRAVVSSIRKLYPEALADKSFDNTGLLLEAPFNPTRQQKNSVLLTIDLTKAVADEAIERKDSIVVAYHPIIFRGLKSLTLADTQQQSLLRLALEGISVYCPHTAIDAAPGGLGDWLADIVTGTFSEPEPTGGSNEPAKVAFTDTNSSDDKSVDTDEDPFVEKSAEQKTPKPRFARQGLTRTYSRPTYPAPMDLEQIDQLSLPTNHTRSVIHPTIGVEGFPNAGMGRYITFSTPQPLTHLINRIARGVGNPQGFPVAIPQWRNVEDIQILTVAICAGSGASVFAGVKADLYFTGEMGHHEALAATEKGSCVVTLFHSNTERGFLAGVLREQLRGAVEKEWGRMRNEIVGDEEDREGEETRDPEVIVEVSERDRDPFGIVILQDARQGKALLEGKT